MTIAESKERLQAVAQYEDFVRELFRGIRSGHSSAGDTVNRMNQLQAQVQQWAAADPGTTEALLYEIHTGIMPSNLNPKLLVIRNAFEQLRTAIEDADQASGGEWFKVT